MQFAETELTAALAGAAKSVLASRSLRRRSARADAAWEALAPYERFKLLDAVGDQVLPVLVALPDVEVAPGTRAAFSVQQVQDAVAHLVGDESGKVKRMVAIKARTALVLTALAHLPPRLDPGAGRATPDS